MTFLLDNGVKFVPEKRFLISVSGNIVSLSENSYRFLILLLEGENDKQKIINQIWHEQRGVVSDSSYYGQIYTLRKSFELVGLSSSLIKTIPRRGVKYVGKVSRNEELSVPYHDDKAYTETPLLSPLDTQSSVLAPEQANTQPDSQKTSRSKKWDIFISTLAVLAVCWLTTLTMMVLSLLSQSA
ncbi:winged helix-turn-helix domain-containing protein [Erwinia sp.]|uniref:winged helix-turn-helix domain-containing protein n=1 Tax=Erwinia citreus TaxID=558 RepID=UPI003C714777